LERAGRRAYVHAKTPTGYTDRKMAQSLSSGAPGPAGIRRGSSASPPYLLTARERVVAGRSERPVPASLLPATPVLAGRILHVAAIGAILGLPVLHDPDRLVSSFSAFEFSHFGTIRAAPLVSRLVDLYAPCYGAFLLLSITGLVVLACWRSACPAREPGRRSRVARLPSLALLAGAPLALLAAPAATLPGPAGEIAARLLLPLLYVLLALALVPALRDLRRSRPTS